jgi:phospholipid/cholesterol/gamma-HCH transport system substrate-binding protein
METRANFVMLGAFTVAGLICLMLFGLWIARANIDREFATYDVVFEGPARGIGPGTEVRFNGIRVGEVKNFRMDLSREKQVVARIRIGAQWPVRADSDARLEPIGLTGVNLIQISAGTPQSPRLKQGNPPPRIYAHAAALDVLLASSERIAQNATEALAGARDMLTTENAARLTRILNNLERVSNDLAREKGAVANVNQAAAEVSVAAAQFSKAAAEFELLAKDARGTLGPLDKKADAVLTAVESAANGVNGVASSASTNSLPELSSAAGELRRLSSTLERLAFQIERSPTFSAVGAQKPTVQVNP